MNSIRPLVTITILVVVGAYLYVKINEGPLRPAPGASDAWPEQSPDGVPPLAANGAVPAPSDNSAPPWSATTTLAPTATTEGIATGATSVDAPPVSTSGTQSTGADIAAQVPTVPAIPEMPELSTLPSPAAANATTSIPLPTELPANIPTAQYPDQPAAEGPVAPLDASASAAPPSTTTNGADEIVNSPIEPAQIPQTPEQANAIGLGATDLSSQPLATQPNPLRQSAPPSAADRYGSEGLATNPATLDAATAPAELSFAASWPVIQAALDRGELARAHQLLSRWHGDPSLTPTDEERVDSLLSQLAGTVVYSTEHQLEPAHVVKPGETLDTIAKQYNVPWELLAKINGIPAADQVRPGQELKVMRGPFSAVVDLDRKQLTITLDGRYAGKFPVSIPTGATVNEGEWLVDQKLVAPSASVTQSSYSTAPAAVDRAIVLRGEANPGQVAGALTLTIASGASPAGPAAGSPGIRVSPQDAEELSAILSIGSRVVIRR